MTEDKGHLIMQGVGLVAFTSFVAIVCIHFGISWWLSILAGFAGWLGLLCMVTEVTETIRKQNILLLSALINYFDGRSQ